MTTTTQQTQQPAEQASQQSAKQTAQPADVPADLPTTFGALKATGWQPTPVKEEIRRNLAVAISEGRTVFPNVFGYEETVIPALENALLACHDVIFLGERGQAKTRMIRSLVGLLDEWLPTVAGGDLHDDPFSPTSATAKEQLSAHADDTPIAWVHRSARFAEKLATPDTSIADLIGEVDPIKVAEGRYLSDELTMHYGLVPRANRGIFAINELPDLAERIQVGLLNVLEERDVQIRGYRIRLPIDVLLVASANPEDYTNRGRIITPLKDRFGSQIRTHYPATAAIEMDIVEQESRTFEADGIEVNVPDYMAEITATLSQLARQSPHVNQRSGVSVRLSVANYETLVASAARRSLRRGESVAVPRMCDLSQLMPSTAGKVETETFEEGRDEEVLAHLVKAAVLEVFRESCDPRDCTAVAEAFTEDIAFSAGDDIDTAAYSELVSEIPELAQALRGLGYEDSELGNPALVASGVEFMLEGLHLSKRLNKDAVGTGVVYRGRTKPKPPSPPPPTQSPPPPPEDSTPPDTAD